MYTDLVSVIIPCYNQAQYLNECLQSVLDQTYSNWECIIVNDGSPDNTKEIAQEWIDKDNRFKYFSKKNGGLSSARNFGIGKSEGEYILALDADDKLASSYMEFSINEFQNNTRLKVVYTKAEKFGEETGYWHLPKFDISRLGLYNMIFCSALYKKVDWERVGGYDEAMIYGLEDWEFWIAILKNGGEVKLIDTIGFFYRIKNNSMLKQLATEEKDYMFDYMSIKHADFYVKHYGSFIDLQNEIVRLKKNSQIKGKKKVLNLFFKTFLGFQIFKIK